MSSSLPTGLSGAVSGSPRPTRSRLRWLGLFLALLLAALAAFTYTVGWWGGNVRTVVPGRFYRSAQLGPGQLREVIRSRGIRTLLNLRGGDEETGWWRRETETCRELGVQFRQVRMTKSRFPTPAELNGVLDILDHAEYPVLIHCNGGADRSGLISAVYLSVYQGVPVARARESQLSLWTGHIAQAAPAMRRFFDFYQQNARGQDLRTWIRTSYADLYPARKMPRTARAPRAAVPAR